MSFSSTSRNVALNDRYLQAECVDYQGSYVKTRINLNSYIANYDGTLQWAAGGNFIASCSNLSLTGSATLQATCAKIGGQQVTSTINLDEKITNYDGRLVCPLSTVPGNYSSYSTDISLRGTVLQAKCKDQDGEYQDSSINLYDYVANIDGCLEWCESAFSDTSRNFTLGESKYLMAECSSKSGEYWQSAINLDEHIINANGQLQIYVSRFIIKVYKENVEAVSKTLEDYYKAHKDTVSTQVAEDNDIKYLYVSASAGKDEGIIFQLSADVEGSVMHVANEHGGIQTVKFDILQAKVNTWAGAGAGVGASINLISAQASVFNLTLGIGVDTRAGIHDDSLTFEALGTGFTVGRKVEISVLGNSFGVDFKRCVIQ